MSRPKRGEEHPREELKARIELMSAIGITHQDIAGILKMSCETLHNHYKAELDLGAAKAGTVVGGKIFEAAKRGESWACTLWAARRMGWKETNRQEQTGADGGAIQTEQTLKADEAAIAFLDEFARLKAASGAQGGMAQPGASKPASAD